MSEVNNSPSSSSASSSKNTGDSLFEPSVEMMVDDFDDERTLEEEEALAAAEADDPNAELSNLQKEGEMPIEELLALYNCSAPIALIPISKPKQHKSKKLSELEEEHISAGGGDQMNDIVDSDENDDDDSPSKLRKLYPETYTLHHHHGDQRLLRTSLSRPPSDDEDDGDYSLDEDDYKKTIMVGSEFQAVIPEGLCRYDDALPYENDDKLLWDPTKVNEHQIEEYLMKSYVAGNNNSSGTSQNTTSSSGPGTNNSYMVNLTGPGGKHLKDDEQALYLLLQCGHNIDEALRRRRINSSMSSQTTSDGMSLWSEEECRNFENGLRTFGKDFHSIQKFKVRTRSVGELVQFYYLWKKTERHDVFANKARLEKKKYNLHPGVTDYMDRFLEEQEGSGANSNSSTIMNQVNSSSSSSISSNERNNPFSVSGGGGGINSGNTYRDRSSSPVNHGIYQHLRSKSKSLDCAKRSKWQINYAAEIRHYTQILYPGEIS